jgi:tetratricopeptide (TPR) repeat protein
MKKLQAGLLLLLLLLGACGGGGPGLLEELEALRVAPASEVGPPSAADPQRRAVPGLILSTNSPSMQEVAGSPEGAGAVVLFVHPDGPSDGSGVQVGDLLVSVDGEEVRNHEHAIAMLRSRPGQGRDVGFVASDGSELGVRITAQVLDALPTPLAYINSFIEDDPENLVLRYVRATQSTDLEEQLSDLGTVLEAVPTFVEARTLRASLAWDQRGAADDDQRLQLTDNALAAWQNSLDVDPRHTTTLVSRASAFTDIGRPNRGLTDAERAINLDPTHPRAHWELARAHVRLGNFEEAAGPARAAIELNAYNDLNYYRTLAEVFSELEREDDCRATAEAFAPFLEAETGPNADAFQEAADSLRGVCG